MAGTVFYFLLAYSPVYRFSSASLAYNSCCLDCVVSVQSSYKVFPLCRLFLERLFLVQYFYCVLRPPSIAISSALCLSCCIHPRKHNRIVVDCFYFTQAITLCLLVYFNSYLQRLWASPSTPVNYHRVQRFIVYECCCTDPKTF
jgi:hypothetical protein